MYKNNLQKAGSVFFSKACPGSNLLLPGHAAFTVPGGTPLRAKGDTPQYRKTPSPPAYPFMTNIFWPFTSSSFSSPLIFRRLSTGT